MLPEDQKRILGYFIEEAKDHLNTIEQGLLNLQATVDDPEAINEVFRAAHSVKGGAAMLGLETIQRTSHRLEDYFKVLKEKPIQADRQLESMLLQVFDGLNEQLVQLQGPFGLTDDRAQDIMSTIEPLFQQVNQHLDRLSEVASKQPRVAHQQEEAVVSSVTPSASPAPTAVYSEASALQLVFRSDVPALLREMLGVFKQADNTGSRQQLLDICQQLYRMGEQFELSNWCHLTEAAAQAVINEEQTYRTIAPVVIKDLKAAQDLVLRGLSQQISISESLQELMPTDMALTSDTKDESLDALLNQALSGDEDESGLAELFEQVEELESAENTNMATSDWLSQMPEASADSIDEDFSDVFDQLESSPPRTQTTSRANSGPAVGAAELNSLADLFEGEVADFEEDWEEDSEDVASSTANANALDVDISNDFADLLLEQEAEEATDASMGDELASLFGESLLEESEDELDLSDLEADSSDQQGEFDFGLEQDDSSISAVPADQETVDLEAEVDEEAFNFDFDALEDGNISQAADAEWEDFSEDLPDLAPKESDSPSAAADAQEVHQSPSLLPEQSSDLSDLNLDESESISRTDVSDFDAWFTARDEEQLDAADTDFLDSLQDSSEPNVAMEPELSFDGDDLNLEMPSELSTAESEAEIASAVEDDLDTDFDSLFQSETSSDEMPELDVSSDDFEAVDLDAFDWESTSLDDTAELSESTDVEEGGAQVPDFDSFDLEPSETVSSDLGLAIESYADNEDTDSFGAEHDFENSSGEESSQESGDGPESGLFELTGNQTSEEFGPTSFFDDDPWADVISKETSEAAARDDLDQDDVDDFFAVDAQAADEPNQPMALESSESFEPVEDFFEVTEPETTVTESAEPIAEELDAEELFSATQAQETEASGFGESAVGSDRFDDPDWIEPTELEMPDFEVFDQVLSDEEREVVEAPTDASQEGVVDEEAPKQLTNEGGDEEDLAESLGFSFGLESEQIAAEDNFVDIDDLLGDISTEELPEHDGMTEPLGEETADDFDELGDLNDLLGDSPANESEASDDSSTLADFDALTNQDASDESDVAAVDDWGDLDALVLEEAEPSSLDLADVDASEPADRISADWESLDETDSEAASEELDDFAGLDDFAVEDPADLEEALAASEEQPSLDAVPEHGQQATPDFDGLNIHATAAEGGLEDEFEDLEKLLEEADQLGGSSPVSGLRRGQNASPRRMPRRSSMMIDQTMRVSVQHLDNLSNLVGELVVNRNSLEQDQERLRQFLENLLFQVQQLNDVGQRMRDLYERSLLESSLISSRQAFQNARITDSGSGNSHATGASFDALEMDRFTGFHTLTQEMIELIVRVRESASDIGFTIESTDQVTRQFRQVTTQLQEGLNKARMVPFAQTADRLPRAVRDISLKCGKEAKLIVEGRDTLIDKMILERLYDPMTHLVNNAITHGVETPEERVAVGKPREGVITVRAFYQGNQTVIYIADDGAGINPDVVREKALSRGIITQQEAAEMSEIELYELLFLPGFSTRDQADDFAGRGVGMDVVRTALAEIRGVVTVDSELGRGTSFTIRLPLTLSISKALSCVNNQARIAFPMDGVEDMFDAPRDRIQQNDRGQSCILWRDTLLPFRPLSDLLQFNRTLSRGRVYGGSQEEDIISIVVLRSANTYIALQVDQVIGEQEIVIKQLEGPVPKPIGIAGATVLGDGRVMPIADVLELIDLALGRMRREPAASLWVQPEEAMTDSEEPKSKSEATVLIVDDSITVRELLSMSFNKVGYRVEQARDGQEAWEKLRSGLPCDLVFCDIEMPRMNGLELLSRMQKDSNLSQIPIAMLTSRGADRHRQMAVDLGAKGYFTKPYLEEILLDAAQRMLNGENMVL